MATPSPGAFAKIAPTTYSEKWNGYTCGLTLVDSMMRSGPNGFDDAPNAAP